MPQEKLQHLQLLKLKRILDWTYNHSPFYRDKFRRAGIGPKDVRGLDDLKKIPLTEKKEWLAAQGERQFEFSSVLAVDESEIVRYHQTSGTTGTAVRLAFSHRDWNWWLECWGYGLAACNLNPEDRVLVCFPFNLFVGWWGGQDAARLLRCRVYPSGSMSTRERLTEYRVIISQIEGLDEVTLKAETSTASDANEALMQDLEAALKLKTFLRFQVELCSPGTFPKQEIKTRRLIDLRKGGVGSANARSQDAS